MQTTLDQTAILEYALQLAQRRKSLKAAISVMRFHGMLTHGIEFTDCPGRSMAYVNRGDTYDSTIIRENDEFSIGSWGDWLESAETDYAQESGKTHCAYCSAWSDNAETCDNCGNNPQGN